VVINLEDILRAALSLPGETRAMLADQLLASLDGPNQKEIDAVWAEEAERRMREDRRSRDDKRRVGYGEFAVSTRIEASRD